MSLRLFLLAGILAGSPVLAAEDLDAALSEIASEVLSYFGSKPPDKIAIATLVHGDGTCSDLSERASDKFQGELFRAKTEETAVIDRRSLSAIFREQQLIEDGTISPSGAAKIAAVEQVDAIVTGKLTQYGDDLEFVVSMLDAVSGTVIGFADSSFRLSTRDEAMLVNRSVGRCGFAPRPAGATPQATSAGIVGAAGGGATQANTGGAVFSTDSFAAQMVSVFYDSKSGNVTFTLRFTNTSDSVLDMSLNTNVMSIQDNAGGVLELNKQISGVAVCTDYRFCNRSNRRNITTIAGGTMAQLNFSAKGRTGLEDLRISLSFEMYVTADAEGDPAPRVVSVGFFDLVPTSR